MNGLLRRLDGLATDLAPFVVSLVLIMFSAMPVNVSSIGPVAPNLGLIAVFYWTIYRPDLMPAIAVLPLGLWQDLMNAGPIGLNALTLLIVYGVILFQRVFFRGKTFLIVWWAFGLMAAFASLVFWLAVMAWHLRYVDPAPLAFQFALTLAVFPFLYWVLSQIQRAIARRAQPGFPRVGDASGPRGP